MRNFLWLILAIISDINFLFFCVVRLFFISLIRLVLFKSFCIFSLLKIWINQSEIKTGKIFDISDKSVALIIKKYAFLAGLDSKKYGGHSLRSGFATSAAESGAEERNIMAMTGHKTTQMVRRYIQEANLFKNNALNKIKI